MYFYLPNAVPSKNLGSPCLSKLSCGLSVFKKYNLIEKYLSLKGKHKSCKKMVRDLFVRSDTLTSKTKTESDRNKRIEDHYWKGYVLKKKLLRHRRKFYEQKKI